VLPGRRATAFEESDARPWNPQHPDSLAGVPADFTVTASSTSSQTGHGAESALDGSSESYWASAYDPEPGQPVVLDLKLGGRKSLTGSKIDWEYPAKAFDVQIFDGKNATTVFADADSSALDDPGTKLETEMYGQAVVGDTMRISMWKTHPRWGSVDNHQLFGIRKVDLHRAAPAEVRGCPDREVHRDAWQKCADRIVKPMDYKWAAY
jgi:hypothetical protein